jgi:rifampicin phosphotransferase
MPFDGVDAQHHDPLATLKGGIAASAKINDTNRFVFGLDHPQAIDAERVGPKAANLAQLARAGLPTPGGFCLTADAYRLQCAALGLDDALARYGEATPPEQRRLSVEIRLKLYQAPIEPDVLAPLLAAWRAQRQTGEATAVRSSALIEDRAGANFAGQFESFLGLTDEAELLTAIRACWAALWTTNARRYMSNHDLNPADTAMAVIVQPVIAARNGRGQHAAERNLGARLGDRAGRDRA